MTHSSAPSLTACVAALLLLSASAAAQLAPWPGGVGIEIGHAGQSGGLPAPFESSGVQWHPGRNTVIVVSDDGLVAEIDPLGTQSPDVWSLPGDLEALALKDPASDLIYVGVENPDSVIEFDLKTGLPTGNAWDLTPWMTGPANEGLEALAYVEGAFYAGQQSNGTIYRFALGPGGAVQFLGSFPSHLGRTDLAGLDYDACNGVLYAVHDTADVIVEYDAAGTFLREYTLTGHDQEGVALMGGSTDSVTRLFMAQDTGEVYRFESYPVTPCPSGTWTDLRGGTAGSLGVPLLAGGGSMQPGWPVTFDLSLLLPGVPTLVWLSIAPVPKSFHGGTLHALPAVAEILLLADGAGVVHASANWPPGLPSGTPLWFQFVAKDPGVSYGFALSNGVLATTP